MTRSELRQLVKDVRAEVRDDDVNLLASAVAFRIFLSIFPSLIAVVAIFGLVTSPGELSRLLSSVNAVLPADAYALLERTLERTTEAASSGLAVAGIAGGFLAASSAAAGLIKALNLAYDVEERRHFVRMRLVAGVMTVVLMIAVASLLALIVLGGLLQDWLVPDSLAAAGNALITVARLAASVVVMIVLFAVIYWLGPNRGPHRFVWVTPGSVFGVLTWLALSGAFSLYTSLFGTYSETYGSLAGAVVLMLWLQLSITTLLVGAELNQVWERRGGKEKTTVLPAD